MLRKSLQLFLAAVFMGGTVFADGFTLASPSFNDKGTIPSMHTCGGENISPELSWTNPPNGTKSFALALIDVNTPQKTVHWVLYNIPEEAHHLGEKIIKSRTLPNGSMQGVNYLNNVGYDGPCPPQGETHTYVFTLYALDTMLGLEPKSNYAGLQNAMRGHVLGEASLSASYQSEKKTAANPPIRNPKVENPKAPKRASYPDE